MKMSHGLVLAAIAAGSPTRSTTIYWTLSTWNPYQVSIMQTDLQFTP